MGSTSVSARCCTVYQSQGRMTAHYLPPVVPAASNASSRPPDPADVTLDQIMCRDLVCARPDLELEALIALMVDYRFGCIPVVDNQRRPIGMITKFDIVEHVHALLCSQANGHPLPADLLARTADELMMPIALTLDESASVAKAALMMLYEDLHHVLVVSAAGTLVGVVSAKDIVTWMVRDRRYITCEPAH